MFVAKAKCVESVHSVSSRAKVITDKSRGEVSPKIQQTKMFVTCQRFDDFISFGLIWQYSSNLKTYNKGRFKVVCFCD